MCISCKKAWNQLQDFHFSPTWKKTNYIIHTFHTVSLFSGFSPHWHPLRERKYIWCMASQGATDDCEDRWQWWHHTFGLGCDHGCLFGTKKKLAVFWVVHEEFVKRMRFLMGYTIYMICILYTMIIVATFFCIIRCIFKYIYIYIHIIGALVSFLQKVALHEHRHSETPERGGIQVALSLIQHMQYVILQKRKWYIERKNMRTTLIEILFVPNHIEF